MNQNISLALTYDDVLIVPKYSEVESRNLVDLTTQISPHITLNLPLISINMTDVTGVEMAIELGNLGGLGFLPRFVSPEKQADMVLKVKKKTKYAAAALGIKEGYIQRADYLVKAGVDLLTIDVAHGHLKKAMEATSYLKNKFGKRIDLISGVIATKEGAEDLFKSGADGVRVGVGPGTICITRIVTGVGVPQITAVMDVVSVAKKYKKTVLCDGGTKNSGDIAKGLAAGASAVVAGSQFAGTKEAPGQIVKKKGKIYKMYKASTCVEEKTNHLKTIKNEVKKNYLAQIEGVSSIVEYKGPVKTVVDNISANLRSAFSYCGASNLKEFWKNASFIRVTENGLRENNAHDVITQW